VAVGGQTVVCAGHCVATGHCVAVVGVEHAVGVGGHNVV
jgi:hypothetical protein